MGTNQNLQSDYARQDPHEENPAKRKVVQDHRAHPKTVPPVFHSKELVKLAKQRRGETE